MLRAKADAEAAAAKEKAAAAAKPPIQPPVPPVLKPYTEPERPAAAAKPLLKKQSEPAPKKAAPKRKKDESSEDEEEEDEDEDDSMETDHDGEEDEEDEADEEEAEESEEEDDDDAEEEEDVEEEGRVEPKAPAKKKRDVPLDTVTTTGRRARSDKTPKVAKSSVFRRGVPTSSSGVVARMVIDTCLEKDDDLRNYVGVTPDVVLQERLRTQPAYFAASLATGVTVKVLNPGDDAKKAKQSQTRQITFEAVHSALNTFVDTAAYQTQQGFAGAVRKMVDYARGRDTGDFRVAIHGKPDKGDDCYLIPLVDLLAVDDIHDWAAERALYAMHPESLRAVGNAMELITQGTFDAPFVKDVDEVNAANNTSILHYVVMLFKWYIEERVKLASNLFAQANKSEPTRVQQETIATALLSVFTKLDAGFAHAHHFQMHTSKEVRDKMVERTVKARSAAAQKNKQLPSVVAELNDKTVAEFCLRKDSKDNSFLPRMRFILRMLPFHALHAMHMKDADAPAWSNTSEFVATEMTRLAETKKLDSLQQIFLCLASQAVANAFLSQFMRVSIDSKKSAKPATKQTTEPKAKKAKTAA